MHRPFSLSAEIVHDGQVKEFFVPTPEVDENSVQSPSASQRRCLQHGFGIFFMANAAGAENHEFLDWQIELASQLCSLGVISGPEIVGIYSVVKPDLSPRAEPSGHIAEVGSNAQASGC